MTGFVAGDRVRVRSAAKPGHVRTPGYLKGHSGWIEGIIGDFQNPEDLAYGLSGLPKHTLYRVGFRQSDLWGGYSGAPEDHLYADIYEHWLEPGGGE